MKFLCFILLLAASGSCKFGGSRILTADRKDYIFDTVTRTYEADFSSVWASGHDVISFTGHTWIPYNFCNTGRLVFADLESDSLVDVQLLNPGCDPVTATIGPQGIHVITSSADVLFYKPGDFLPTVLFNLNAVPEYARSGMMPEWHKPGSDQHFDVPENVLYFRVNQNYDSTDGRYSKYLTGYPVSAKLDLHTREIKFFGKTPKSTSYGQYGLLSSIFDLYKNDTIVYTNAIDGDITVINTLTGKTSVLNRPSSHQDHPVKKLNTSGISDLGLKRQAKWDHGLLSASYEPLFYSPYDRHYYRIFHPEMQKLNAEGLYNTEEDKRAVLIVFDEAFRIVDEIVLPLRGSNFVKLFPLSEGLAIILKEGITQEGKYVRLRLFRIRKKTGQ
jgi:hypothetical protein